MNIPNGAAVQTYHFTGDESKHAIGTNHKKRKQFQENRGIIYIYLLDQNGVRIYEKDKTKCYSFKIGGENGNAVDRVMIKIASWLEKCSQRRKKDERKLNKPMEYFGEYAQNYHLFNQNTSDDQHYEDLIENFSHLHLDRKDKQQNTSISMKTSLFSRRKYDEPKWIQHDETHYDEDPTYYEDSYNAYDDYWD